MSRRRLLLAALASGLSSSPWVLAQSNSTGPSPLETRRDYARVVPRTLTFPADHGAHPDFRTEWWYLTVWMRHPSDRGTTFGPNAFGLQLTFFRRRTGIGEANPSRFAPRQLLLAHAAVSLPSSGLHRHDERAGRAGVAGVHYSEVTTDLSLNGWTFRRLATGQYLAELTLGELTRLRLTLEPTRPPTLRGTDGFSQKGPHRDYASYYYSHTHMRVQLEAQTQDQTLALPRVSEGLGWFDHEWSSSILPPGAVGWDWIGIHLLDGGSLMAFQLRSKMGEPVWTEFDERDRDGRRKASGKGAPVRWEPVGQWRSPNSLAVYPGAWILHTAERRLEIRPLMPNQEFDGRFSIGIVYWEGAVELYDGPRLIGRGYLEMTGYAQAMQL